MKTTIEINGYNVVIEDNEGVISVSAQKDDETVEEFTVDTNEEGTDTDDDNDGSEEGQELKEFGQDEIEAGQDEVEEGQDEIEAGQDEEETEGFGESLKLESFRSFIKKRNV